MRVSPPSSYGGASNDQPPSRDDELRGTGEKILRDTMKMGDYWQELHEKSERLGNKIRRDNLNAAVKDARKRMGLPEGEAIRFAEEKPDPETYREGDEAKLMAAVKKQKREWGFKPLKE